jgi:hypothetical protein
MSTIKSSAENLTLNADGANNDIKFQSNGSEVAQIDQAGVISSTGGTTHADNVKAKFGTGGDLEIFHDGSNSYIHDTGTGDLYLKGSAEVLIRSATNENMIKAVADGAVSIYHNNAKKIETTATGVDVTGAITVNGAALASGLTEADQWRITTDVAASGVTQITANWERADTYGSNKLGTGMTESSGVFTFPSTGFWRVDYQFRCNSVAVDVRYIFFAIETSTNGGSNWNIISEGAVNISNFMSGTEYNSSANFALIDVTSTSNVKVRVRFDPSAYVVVDGHTSSNETGLLFTKLAET